jgi:hypothetical protein
MNACIYEIGAGFFEGGCSHSAAQSPISATHPHRSLIRELAPAHVSRGKGERGSRRTSCPVRPNQWMALGHKVIYVMVVAVLDAGAGPPRPRGPHTVADAPLAEGSHAGLREYPDGDSDRLPRRYCCHNHRELPAKLAFYLQNRG